MSCNRLAIPRCPLPTAPEARAAATGRAGRRAFSLIEIMVVIVIIGLLAGVVGINVRNYLIRARQNVARQDIANISRQLDAYWAEFSRYPSTEEGIRKLTEPSPKTKEPFLEKMPLDPWGNAYEYLSPGSGGQKYEIISYGADGKPGGDGADGDITSDNLQEG